MKPCYFCFASSRVAYFSKSPSITRWQSLLNPVSHVRYQTNLALLAKQKLRHEKRERAQQLLAQLPAYSIPSSGLHLTTTESALNAYLHKVALSPHKESAFDMEWNTIKGYPERRTGVIQIAHKDAGVLIYSIPRHQSASLPPSLLSYLASDTHLKIGVNVRNDLLKLQRDFGVERVKGNGLLDLSYLAKAAQPDHWRDWSYLISLQNLTARYLGRYLAKGDVRTRSNWEGYNIKQSALQYAAGDVLASLDIYYKLLQAMIPQLLEEPQAVLEVLKRSTSPIIKSQSRASSPASTSAENSLPKAILTPRQSEAWERGFGDEKHVFTPVEELATIMGIQPNSVRQLLVNAMLRSEAETMDKLSTEQKAALLQVLEADEWTVRRNGSLLAKLRGQSKGM